MGSGPTGEREKGKATSPVKVEYAKGTNRFLMPDYLPYLSSFLENDHIVYFVYDLQEQRMLYASARYEQLFGEPVPAEPQHPLSWLTRIHPDDTRYLLHCLTQAVPDEPVQNVELRLLQADGRIQWLALTAGLRSGAQGPCLSGRVEDITRAKEIGLNAQKFTTKKDATLEILSHDMATPLVLLQQLTEHLRWEAKEAGEPAQHLLRLMERTCVQGLNLIRDFVDNEFFESVNVTLKRERADLVAWLATIMEEYQRSTYHTHLHFHFDAAAEPLYMEMDINKLQQVFNNLVSNAIKFTPDGGRISVGVMRREERAVVTVADNGIGIPAELQAGLFERFTKARRPGLRGEKSNGLGMSIIQTVVALHQGTISCASEEGHGTTFTIELPALPQ